MAAIGIPVHTGIGQLYRVYYCHAHNWHGEYIDETRFEKICEVDTNLSLNDMRRECFHLFHQKGKILREWVTPESLEYLETDSFYFNDRKHCDWIFEITRIEPL